MAENAARPRTGDLRREPVEAVVEDVQRRLHTDIVAGALLVKRRSIGAVTSRGTWVRIERRYPDRLPAQGWGIEAAHGLVGVARPAWYQGMSWYDGGADVLWRVDETELISEPTLRSGGTLQSDPGLTAGWWAEFNRSLDALNRSWTLRAATPDTVPVTQGHVTEAIHRAFPGVDTTVRERRAAHADLNFANLTGPNQAVLVDWEDWGMAPRGLDAAQLWVASLAVPALAERILYERREDMESHDGKLMRLFMLATKVLTHPVDSDPLLKPARRQAVLLLEQMGLSASADRYRST